MRVFYLVLANLALPFLLYYLRNVIYKLIKKDVPQLNWKKSLQLFACGIILLTSVLMVMRLSVEPQARGDYNKVKQYDFR